MSASSPPVDDVLSEVLGRTALKGTVYFKAEFGSPWAMQIGEKDVAAFHIVVRGRCWVRSGSEEPFSLNAGDVVVFPHGDPHALLHDVDAEPVPAERLLAQGRAEGASVSFGGTGESVTLMCGHFERDSRLEHPLFATLPARIHVPASEVSDGSWMITATELAVMESSAGRPGSGAVVDRLAEALLIQVLRGWSESVQHSQTFLAALTDEALSRAISLVHRHPARPWCVEDLARAAGLGRSAFSERFRERVGITPMAYVTDWRMRLAHEMLVGSERTMAQVAETIGYDSEWSFAKAFKRIWGQSPGAVRRSARAAS